MLREPTAFIPHGYDIHLVFEKPQLSKAVSIFEAFQRFLNDKKIPFDRAIVFEEAVGPWPGPMWQILLPQSSSVYTDLGLSISWLMLNRDEFSVMIHPNSLSTGDSGGGYEDHSQNMLWMGPPLTLSLDIFTPPQ